jgi:hypothetical protein
MLTTHPLLVPRLRKSRRCTSCHPKAPIWSVTGPLYLYLFILFSDVLGCAHREQQVTLWFCTFWSSENRTWELGRYRLWDTGAETGWTSWLLTVFWDFLSHSKQMRYGTLNWVRTAWSPRPVQHLLIILSFHAVWCELSTESINKPQINKEVNKYVFSECE